MTDPVVVEFPLRGEWRATNTPAEKVPSHGTDYFGQRYAYDFVQMDETGIWFYPGDLPVLWRHYTKGIPASAFYCWDEPVHAAFAGRVAEVGAGWRDRATVQALWEIVRTTFMPPINTPEDHRPLAGNYVIMEGDGVFAFYGHLRSGSVAVAPGEDVVAGAILGNVGNSGNSTMPHLHFHLMDRVHPLSAKGVPCAFRGYERLTGDRWEPVSAGMPGSLERVRSAATARE